MNYFEIAGSRNNLKVVRLSHPQDGVIYGLYAETVLVSTDTGTTIEVVNRVPRGVDARVPTGNGAFQNVIGRLVPPHVLYNCHGFTFLNGRFWLDDDQVATILQDEYAETSDEAQAEIVVLFCKQSLVVHSAVRDVQSGTYASKEGDCRLRAGLALNEVVTPYSPASWRFYRRLAIPS
jgi:hypothetical protein